jgi:hypothetical protein
MISTPQVQVDSWDLGMILTNELSKMTINYTLSEMTINYMQCVTTVEVEPGCDPVHTGSSTEHKYMASTGTPRMARVREATQGVC